jgi:hypothetical protein
MFTAFEDRLVLADADGEHVRPMRDLARIGTRRAFPRPRLVLTFVDGETWEIRGLRALDATAAHRTIFRLATDRRG